MYFLYLRVGFLSIFITDPLIRFKFVFIYEINVTTSFYSISSVHRDN